jgi:phosphoribosylglycinamide formyltransferase-1
MNHSPLAVFAYNFPHKKTQDFLLRLLVDGFRPALVIAADPVQLNIPKPTVRVKVRHIDLVHPADICRALNIPYQVVPHNSPECADLLREAHIAVALIAGARILKEPVISSVTRGIINIHPGWLPDVRGLDALQWAIYHDLPLGVTAHTIDERIDAGRILVREKIAEYPDDTLLDLSLRLEQTQNNIISASIQRLLSEPLDQFEAVGKDTVLHRKMPPEMEAELAERLKRRQGRLNGGDSG